MLQPTIDLVWAANGPVLDAARRGLHGALARTELLPAWNEWKAHDPLRPRRLKARSGGPCLYVNGRLVWESRCGWRDESSLALAIVRASTLEPVFRIRDPLRRRMKYVILPSAALARLPKCPLCWIAYASVTMAFGVAPLAARRYAIVGLSSLVVLAVATIVWRSRRIRNTGPVWPLTVGASLVLIGGQTSQATAFAGLILMLGAAGWSAWP